MSKLHGLKYISALFILFLISLNNLSAQSSSDSLLQERKTRDSLRRVQKTKDSLLKVVQLRIRHEADSVKKATEQQRKRKIDGFQLVLKQNPYFNAGAPAVRQLIQFRKKESSDGVFYFVVALVLYIALMRLFFYKYMSTMFTLFFRATLRQQQLREQLLQAPLPALLMNIFFVISLGTYCTFLAVHYELPFADNFWTTLPYAFLLILCIYLVKFIFLNMVGWIFGITNVTDTYIFIVFLINKMIGIFLLPFIALMAFPTDWLLPVAVSLSYVMVAGMLFYRFLISYRPVRNEIKLNRFHFFLYLCAFEIAPLLLIYKVLLTNVNSSF
jgi:Domain of unknown function (DUF4271)